MWDERWADRLLGATVTLRRSTGVAEAGHELCTSPSSALPPTPSCLCGEPPSVKHLTDVLMVGPASGKLLEATATVSDPKRLALDGQAPG